MKRAWWRMIHEEAVMSASYERYQQDTVHDWAQDVMPGEDARKAPAWMRLLPLSVVHQLWLLHHWLLRFYVTHLAWILTQEMKRVVVCGYFGHDYEDTGSWGNPESGGEDMTCRRCGHHVRHVYY